MHRIWIVVSPILVGLCAYILIFLVPDDVAEDVFKWGVLCGLVGRVVFFVIGKLRREALPEPERCVLRLGFFLPKKIRQDVIGDLLEEIPKMRAEGLSEGQILRRVASQLLLAFLQRPVLWWVTIVTWFGARIGQWL